MANRSANRLRIAAAILLNFLLLALVGAAFYAQDLRYAKPTPRPKGYVAPVAGLKIGELAETEPTLLCFAQSGCACTRFNQDHLFALAKEFGDKVKIVEVVEDSDAGGLTSPGELRMDPTGAFAKKCGVYSTPQAVVLDSNGKLLFRGNFNAGRYCSDPATEYARIALEAIVAGRQVPAMPKQALTPYGCAIGALADWGGGK